MIAETRDHPVEHGGPAGRALQEGEQSFLGEKIPRPVACVGGTVRVRDQGVAVFEQDAADLVGDVWPDANDRAGAADAPNKLIFALPSWQNQSFSAVPAWADGFKKAYTEFIGKHPDWQIEFRYQGDDSGQVAASLIEQAKAGSRA